MKRPQRDQQSNYVEPFGVIGVVVVVVTAIVIGRFAG